MKRGVVQGRFSILQIQSGGIWLLIGIVVLLTIGCTTAQTHSSNNETPWQIVRGQQQAKLWSTEGLLGLSDPRIYVATGASSSVIAPDHAKLFLTETLQLGWRR
jgi:hypothetical protein